MKPTETCWPVITFSFRHGAPPQRLACAIDGGENYGLTIPGPVPAELSWSVTVYDSETRPIIDTDQGRGAVRMLFEKPQANAEGSFDVYFGPDEPTGNENQWVKTTPEKGWFTFVRMYGPQQSLFDGIYKLPDTEKLD